MTKITEEMFASIPGLIAEGMTREQIAERFGTTPGSLQVMCCRRGISLLRKGRRMHQKLQLNHEPIKLHQVNERALYDKAQALGMDGVSLATKLLNTIIKDDLFVAVLDTERVS